MSALFNDPMFFYAIAFAIFIGLAVRFGRKPALNLIDSEIIKIRDELEQARKLRADAEAMLTEYKAKQKTAMAEAEAIVAGAKDEAARLKEKAEAELKSALVRHEQQALERIRVAEAEAASEVRTAAINIAMEIANKTLATNLDDAASAKLIDQAIADISKSSQAAKSKAEAA